jgi:hypothetical protein
MLSHLPIEVLKITQKGCERPSGDLAIPEGGIGLLLPGWLLVLGLQTFPGPFPDRVAKTNELFAVSSTPEQIGLFVNFCIHSRKFFFKHAI